MLFSVFIYGKFNSNYYVKFYLFTFFKLFKSSPQIIHLILDYLIFLGSFNIGGYLVVAYIGRLVPFFSFFSDCTFQTIFWTLTLSHLKVFSISIHKKCKSNHYLLLLAFFSWSANETVLACKLYGNIYDIYVAIVFGTLLFSTFWRLWKLFFFIFLTKRFLQILYSRFLFIQKTAKLVLQKLP